MSFPLNVKDCAVSVYTLGCKLNQLESESISDAFRREGFPIETGESATPTILIVNTCTVTSKSEQKARRHIRKALRDNKETVLIVTGCYAQLEAQSLESLDSSPEKRLFVIPGDQKNRILELPAFLAATGDLSNLHALVCAWANNIDGTTELPDSPEDKSFVFEPEGFSLHSRSFIKIQDGCNNQCSYCRVHIARGRSRSRDVSGVLHTLKSLEQKGYEEAVLTGVNISQYLGKGKDGFCNLAELLEHLLAETETIRIRLSSIEPEPDFFSPAFIRAISHKRIQPHFHLSLQSASSTILKRMNRSYSPEQAMEYVTMLRCAKNDPFLGCDIITGFPGETDIEFEKTFDFCQKAGFAGIHAFPFSRRPGTAAWDFKDRITEKEAGIRAGRLIDLAVKQRREYVSRWLGREVQAIAEESSGAANTDENNTEGNGIVPAGYTPALSENYLKLLIYSRDGNKPKPGKAYQCRILEKQAFSKFDALAEIINI